MVFQRLKVLILLILLALAVVLILRTAYLELTASPDADPAGTLLVWHSWEEDEALVLQEIVAKYTDLHPEVRVILTAIEAGDLLARFQEAAEIGFGPDLFIGPSTWIPPLAQADLIVPIDEDVEENTRGRYLPAALETLHYQDHLYGIPMTVHTLGLYYNETIVAEPATTLADLVAQAQAGVEVGLNTSFENAFWGIRAFGGRLFDEEGQAILDQGGFANWLTWLKNAQDVPAFILSNDQAALRTLFAEGKLGYLIDSSLAWREFQADREMAEDTEPDDEGGISPDAIGVRPLPDSPTGSPGPFLGVEALLFSAASSHHQTVLALDLARFLTNAEQQTTLMRQTEQIPANSQVRINARLNPIVAAFAAQARAAVPYPTGAEEILRLGTDAYARVLEGLLTPAEAAMETTVAINQALGFEVEVAGGDHCESAGDFTFWHTWDGLEAQGLQAVLDAFHTDCPNIHVHVEQVHAEELLARLGNAAANNRPDLLLTPHTLLLPLVDGNFIRSIDPLVEPELLQRYRSLALDAFRYTDVLYGLPVSLQTQALVYATDQVEIPAHTLDDLLMQAEQGRRIALNLDFADLFWGIPAFGGQLINEADQVVLDEAAFAAWLAWLQQAEQNGALVLGEEAADLNERFLNGETAYRVVPSTRLRQFVEVLGEDAVGIATLPSGPAAEAGPLATASGLTISTGNTVAIQPVLAFARYVTSADTQRLLMEISSLLPANANVDVSSDPLLEPYAEQLATAILYPNRPEIANLMAVGSDGYVWVQSGVLTPEEAAAEVSEMITQAGDVSALAPDSVPWAGAGTVQIWSAATGVKTAFLDALNARTRPSLDDQLAPETTAARLLDLLAQPGATSTVQPEEE